MPPAKRRRAKPAAQTKFELTDADEISTAEIEFNPSPIINEIRALVDNWRNLPNPAQWGVTPTTARLLTHWRSHDFTSQKPFFCQIEAVETMIWLTEVAPGLGVRGRKFLDHVAGANAQSNPALLRLAMKMATGSGKTTVMAMLIAWQTLNAVRQPGSSRFNRGFLIVTPGITIRDRLRVLFPNDPNSYYRSRQLVPDDMLGDIGRAIIVLTNYHAFKRRERNDISRVGRVLLQGRAVEKIDTLETEGQMLARVMKPLMGAKNINVLNDEAHHCYRERPGGDIGLTGDDKAEAKKNAEAARLWITGIETAKRHMGVRAVYDLSATPFFLRGSGYPEGVLFGWTVSDFSLMDAIESGIVKLPRVPVADNLPTADMPIYRDLWAHIGKEIPKKGAAKSGELDPLKLPNQLNTALDALYGHYEKTYAEWDKAGITIPPVFIVVCNNTATSKLVYDYISGFTRVDAQGKTHFHDGRLALFRNYGEDGARLPRMRTLLIDSEQLESDDALDPEFRAAASAEIDQFKRELIQRDGAQAADAIDDKALLREVMNTVGRVGRLGEPIRCVVSVSMLTEGWDTNTVTHVLGVRAFGTQLLCEQVVGRALRRQSYDLNADGMFDPEYADILGIPFDFTAKPVVAKPAPPRQTIAVQAMRERAALEITFPRVSGYRTELPDDRVTAHFGPDHVLHLTPDVVGPTRVLLAGVVGADHTIGVTHLNERLATIAFHLARNLLFKHFRDDGGEPKLHLFGPLKTIARHWLDTCLVCAGGAEPAQLLYQHVADQAAERIYLACQAGQLGQPRTKAILDPYNPEGSSVHVQFNTSKPCYATDAGRCHVNFVVEDSGWEAEFARVAEAHPAVRAYVKNQGLGFEVPYRDGDTARHYRPDFIVRIDDGRADLLNLVVEIKGFRGGDAQLKAETMRGLFVPGVNNLGRFGRWDFVEFRSLFDIERDFGDAIEALLCARAA